MYVPLKNTSFMYGHVTINGKGAAKFRPFLVIMSLELGEIYMYIVPHLLSPCRGVSVFAVSS